MQACLYSSAAGVTWFELVKEGAVCEPWVTWVMLNMGFHAVWVSCLTACQLYQVIIIYHTHLGIKVPSPYFSIYLNYKKRGFHCTLRKTPNNTFFHNYLSQVICLAMTTNERMNAGRYKHFTRNRQGNIISPFNKGMVNNIADVTGKIFFI